MAGRAFHPQEHFRLLRLRIEIATQRGEHGDVAARGERFDGGEESFDDALKTLQHLKRGQPKLRYLSFMEAELHAKREDWKAAWAAWEEFEGGSQ